MSDEIHEEVRDDRNEREKAYQALRKLNPYLTQEGRDRIRSMSYHGSEIHQGIQDRARQMSDMLASCGKKRPWKTVGEDEVPDYALMLSQIAGLVEEFCDENTTTLDGVKLMKAELYQLRAEKLRQEAGRE